MLSNDVEALGPDESCEALLLTAKARIVAPMTVYRRGADDFLLLTEPELAERAPRRAPAKPLRRQGRVELEEHESAARRRARDACRRDREPRARRRRLRGARRGASQLARDRRRTSSSCLRIRAGRRASGASSTIASCRPRPGSTSERSTSRRAATRARSRSRASTTAAASIAPARARARRRRASRIRRRARARREGRRPRDERDPRWRRTSWRSRTSASRFPQTPRSGSETAAVSAARLALPAPVAQGIERCPAEAEVASSNLAGRTHRNPAGTGFAGDSWGWGPSRRVPSRRKRFVDVLAADNESSSAYSSDDASDTAAEVKRRGGKR